MVISTIAHPARLPAGADQSAAAQLRNLGHEPPHVTPPWTGPPRRHRRRRAVPRSDRSEQCPGCASRRTGERRHDAVLGRSRVRSGDRSRQRRLGIAARRSGDLPRCRQRLWAHRRRRAGDVLRRRPDCSHDRTGNRGQRRDPLVGIDRRPADGSIVGISEGGVVYTIDIDSAAATAVGAAIDPALESASLGFDFNPTVDRIRAGASTARTCGSTRTPAPSARTPTQVPRPSTASSCSPRATSTPERRLRSSVRRTPPCGRRHARSSTSSTRQPACWPSRRRRTTESSTQSGPRRRPSRFRFVRHRRQR